MAAARRPSRQPATRTDAQVRLIHDAFNGADPPIRIKEVRFTQGPKEGEVDFLCEDGVILARTEDADRVTEVLLRQTAPRRRPDLRLPGATNGVVRLTLEGTAFDDVIRALEAIDAELGVGVATPNHVLSITPVTGCPATEPEEVDPAAIPDPGVCPSGGNGARVLVHVLDTGLARCMAPATEVFVRAAFVFAGATLEIDFVKEMETALAAGADVISLSAGTSTRYDVPLLAFEAFWRARFPFHKGVVLVAAAGNNSDRRPFWPAAFERVVSVGALDANWRNRAFFSDYGGWVDVYAPGEGLVNAFATGDFTCKEPPYVNQVRHFEGMARWSGTSFSTPLVAGGPVLLPCLDDR